MQALYNIQRAIIEVEWLDRHVTARDPIFNRAVANHIDELRERLYRAMDAATDEEVNAPDTDELPEDALERLSRLT